MRYAIGMRRGGTIWWDDGKQYVDLQKRDGPVIIIALDGDDAPEYPNLSRILKTATHAELDGTTYREAHDKLTEQPVEGWWGRFAAALLDLALNLKNYG